MSNLIDNDFVRKTKKKETRLERIKWWEKKRIRYNLIIGTISLIILGTCGFVLGRFEELIEFFFYYLFFLNCCFTLGWIVEILVLSVFRSDISRYRQAFYLIGLLLPICHLLLVSFLIYLD